MREKVARAAVSSSDGIKHGERQPKRRVGRVQKRRQSEERIESHGGTKGEGPYGTWRG